MAIHYTFERDCVLAPVWRCLQLPEEVVQRGQLELAELEALLRADGVAWEDVQMLCYFDQFANAYIRLSNSVTIPPDPGFILRLTLRKDKSTKIRDLMTQISRLSDRITELTQRLELLEQPSPDGRQLSTYSPETNEIDIAVLLAAPLVRVTGRSRSGLYHSNLDFESDKRRLINYLRNNDVRAALRFEAASINSLGKLLQAKPSVLQIECHGCFKNDVGGFFLAFESSRNMGELFELDKESLRNALQDTMRGSSANLIVLVNACYSETVANVFLESGVRCVVAVHQQTRILDVAVREFTHEFYRQLFSRNQSVRDAFTLACQAVKREQATLITCCCAHEHTPNCKWNKKAKTDKESLEQCREHTATCTCRTARVNNLHKSDCQWALDFLFDYTPERTLTEEELRDGFVVCCCRPEIPHGESMKFAFYSDKEFENFHINSKVPREVKHTTPDVPIPPAVTTRTFGQHDKIQELVAALGKNSMDTHFINVVGETGVGKTVIVKRAAYYAFERHAFPQGVIYIDMTGRTNVSYIYREVENVFKTSGIKSKQEFCQFLRDQSILLIIDGTDDILRYERENFRLLLLYLIENTYSPKILVVSRDSVNLEATSICVKPLSPHRAAELLVSLAGEALPSNLRRDLVKLGKHQLFKLIGTCPQAIKLAASGIQGPGDLDKIVQSHEQDQRAQTQEMIAYQMAFDFLSVNLHRGNLFLLLSFFPAGLHRNDIILLCDRLGIAHVETLREFEEQIGSEKKDKSWFIEEKEGWFTAHPGFSQYLTKRSSRDLSDFISEIARYLAELSRHLVRQMAPTSPYIDLSSLRLFNAVVDDGLWRAPNEIEVSISIPQQFTPQKFYEKHERNFLQFLNVEILNRIVENEPTHRFKTFIGELALCTATCALLLFSRDQALEILEVGEKACDRLNHRKAFCTLMLMEASMVESRDVSGSLVLTATQGFTELDCSDGIVETYLFQLLSKDRFSAQELKTTLAVLKEQLSKSLYPHLAKARMDLAVAELKIQSEQSKPQILTQLNRALGIFNSMKRDHWALRTNIAKVDYYFFEGKLKDAKRICDEAVGKCQGVKSRTLEKILKEKQVLLNRELQKRSQNVASFSFLKSYPLVKMSGHEFERAGPIARVFNPFRATVMETLAAAKKQIYVKFDHCTVENLVEVLKSGCTVLHLSSTEPVKSGFAFENVDGSVHLMTTTELIHRLGRDLWQNLKVLILEAPYCHEMALTFHKDLNIPHIIGFHAKDFPTSPDTFPLIDIVDSAVVNFCTVFYQFLLQCESVHMAFTAASAVFQDSVLKCAERVSNAYVDGVASLNLAQLSKGAFLIDQESEVHLRRLFAFSYSEKQHMSEIVVETGDMRDLSKPRAPTNLQKELGAHVGRHLPMYKSIKLLEDGKCVHVTGARGIGKTMLLQDIGYMCLLRNAYLDGIYYLSLKGKSQLDEQFRTLDLIQSSDQLSSLENKKILLLMDDCDTLMIKQQQFLYLLRFLATKCKLGVIFSSKLGFSHASASDFISNVELTGFSSEEAAVYCFSLDPSLTHLDVDSFAVKESIIESLASTNALSQTGLTPKILKEIVEKNSQDPRVLQVEENEKKHMQQLGLEKSCSSVSYSSGEMRVAKPVIDLHKSDRGLEPMLIPFDRLDRPRSGTYFQPCFPVHERQDSEDTQG